MSGECEKCGEYSQDCQCSNTVKFDHGFIKKLIDIGVAKEKIKNLLDAEFFRDLSKHNPYFDSKYIVECEKLYDLRMFLSGIESTLYDIIELINR